MASLVRSNQYRVILSGTGGDEMNGQALNPAVSMADLLAHFHLVKVSREVFRWSLLTRTPYLSWLGQVITELLPIAIRTRFGRYGENHPWINRDFVRRYGLAARELEQVSGSRFYRPGPRDALQTITTLSREMTRLAPSRLEQRYPYLDQNLVEFLTSIPFDQLLRPGERRHLMRRALRDIVPPEVLSRRTKVSASRCYAITVGKHWNEIEGALVSPLSERMGFIYGNPLRRSLAELKTGQAGEQIGGLLKALSLEFWLRDISARQIIAWPTGAGGIRTV
jgi:asparagine synthase (glutamine-hydrolysing)